MFLMPFRPMAQTLPEFPVRNELTSENWDTASISAVVRYAVDHELGRTNPDSAINLMSEIYAASIRLSYHYGRANSLFQLASAYAARSLYEEAEATFREAIPYSLFDIRSHHLLPRICNNLGRIYHIRGNLAEAAKSYYQGIRLGEYLAPDENFDYVYSNLGAILIHMGRPPEQCRYYLNKAEAGALKKGNYYVLGNVLINQGITFNHIKLWDSSIHYFEKALSIGTQHRFDDVSYLAYSNLGIAWLEKKQPQRALDYLERADSISRKKLIDLSYMNNTGTALGGAYMQLGRFTEAENVLLQAKNRATLLHQPLVIREAHWNLAKLYGAMGQYQKGYEETWAYIQLNDSISGKEIINNVNQIEVKYRTAEKDKELIQQQLLIARQERDIQRKNLWITSMVSGSVILILLSAGLYSRHRNRRKLLHEQLANLQQRQEIERLKAMMEGEENERNRIARELHDGIGGLIAAAQLNTAVLKKESPSVTNTEAYQKLRDILDDIGKEVRKTAHNMMPEILLHHSLPEAIRHFCRHIGQNRELSINVQAYGAVEQLSDEYRLSVYRIVQELIHNVVKHADATEVLVQIMLEHPVLSITVEDNGQGFEVQQQSKKGAGLYNLHNRLKSMNGTISIKSEPGRGTSVYIEINLPENQHSIKNPILERPSIQQR